MREIFTIKTARMLLIAGTACVLAAPVVFTADSTGSGTTAVQILGIAPDARSTAMGGAFTAVSNDAGAVFYNPAGLALIHHTEIPLAANNLFDNVRHEYLGIVYNLDDIKVANVKNLGTVACTLTIIDSGNITGRDASGNVTGNFRARNSLVTASYGRCMFENRIVGAFNAGASVKVYKEKMSGKRSEGEAYDVGLLWKYPRKHIYVAAAFQNFGKKAKYISEKFDLPYTTTLGVSGRILDEMLIVDMDVSIPSHADLVLKAGAEYWYMKTVALRFGYNSRIKQQSGLTVGFGLSLKEMDIHFFYGREITIDYAFTSYNDLEDLHRFSVNIKLGAD